MLVRLALADRDIQSAFSEQQFLVQRFLEIGDKILRNTDGKQGAVSANQLLREEAPEFEKDAKILIAAGRASLLSGQAWLRHDLEHNARNVPSRLRGLEEEMAQVQELVNPLTHISDLNKHAQECLSEMNWFSRGVLNRGLAKEISRRTIDTVRTEAMSIPKTEQTVFIWRDQNSSIKSIVLEAGTDEG